jgi:hypothetical protein
MWLNTVGDCRTVSSILHQYLDPVAPDELVLPCRLLTPVNTVNLKDVL